MIVVVLGQAVLTAGLKWTVARDRPHLEQLVDGSMALVGSVNINRRSVEKDEEVAVAIFDRELTSLLESHFQEDVARSIAARPLRPIRSEM